MAEALVGLGRAPEALERAERGASVARERGLGWTLPRSLRALAMARMAAGEPRVGEVIDEGQEAASATGQPIEFERLERIRESAPAASA